MEDLREEEAEEVPVVQVDSQAGHDPLHILRFVFKCDLNGHQNAIWVTFNTTNTLV